MLEALNRKAQTGAGIDRVSRTYEEKDLAFIRGVALISGVYTIYAPLSDNEKEAFNVLFRKIYCSIVFGSSDDLELLSRSSTTTHLWARIRRRSSLPPISEITYSSTVTVTYAPSTSSVPMSIPNQKALKSSSSPSGTPPLLGASPKQDSPKLGMSPSSTPSKKKRGSLFSSGSDDSEPTPIEQKMRGRSQSGPSAGHFSCPFIVFNATFDLGLEHDGDRITAMLKEYGVQVERKIIHGSNHGSIVKSQTTFDAIDQFFLSIPSTK